ncbi:hypothetical protein AURANDRAFT_22203, partial [Aureococcus anophagefferens]
MKVAEVDDADLDEKLYFIDVETETGGTALLVACAAGNVLLADELLQRGAEANHENLRGHTALSWACVCGADGVVDLLLRNGADPRRPTKLEQRTPLVHAAQHGHAKVLQILWRAGAMINAETKRGRTPLIEAAKEGHLATCRYLVDRGARRPRVDGENRYGHTALTMAVVKGRFDVVQALLDRGAKADRRSLNKRGWTPLRFAAERDKAKAVELLMLRGGDPYAVADDGLTPMDVARKKGF